MAIKIKKQGLQEQIEEEKVAAQLIEIEKRKINNESVDQDESRFGLGEGFNQDEFDRCVLQREEQYKKYEKKVKLENKAEKESLKQFQRELTDRKVNLSKNNEFCKSEARLSNVNKIEQDVIVMKQQDEQKPENEKINPQNKNTNKYAQIKKENKDEISKSLVNLKMEVKELKKE